MKIGVYFCNCGTNIADKIDAEQVKESILGGGSAAYVKTCGFLCSEEGKEFLEKDLKQEGPDRVVIAACSPREHEKTFMRALSHAEINPYLMQMVNIREQVAWVTPDKGEATEKAWGQIRGAIARVAVQEPLEKKELEMCPDTLIIGAGPAGLKAALSIAEAGRKVVLVEKAPVIGGMPVRYEEIAPTMECGPCMLEPMLGDLLHGEHADKIEILTLAEVADIAGFYGNFDIKIKQSPRFVDLHTCIGCGECITPCPASSENPFNCGLNTKKAIDFPFLGALPNAPFLDSNACVRSKGEDCHVCKDACVVGPEVINYDDKELIIERKVGAIIVAIGSSLYDCRNIPGLGYGKIPDVHTSLEFERIMASNGPTGGELKTADGRSPDTVAIIHCVGSLDKAHKEYCSGICCEYAFKFNHAIEKKLPDTKVVHFYKELVMPGKEEYALYLHAKENPHASFIRYGNITDIAVSSVKGKTAITYKDASGKSGTLAPDMVVLCPAVVPAEASGRLGALLELSSDRLGFFEELHGRIDSSKSKIKGIYLAGTCQSPMDIQKATNQGMAAAGYVLSGLVEGRKLDIEPITAVVDEGRCSGCRVCVSICPYKAISFDNEKKVSLVNAVLCQGCGTCVAACPAAAIKGHHFTSEEIFAEIEGVLS
jgi:heterodisulfide reductase subunit A